MIESIPPADITGLVLAGGRGRRFGGRDKGLEAFQGGSLVERALLRLRPQVGISAINANRNLDRYAAFGVPVWPDSMADHPGPLAGLLTGLQHCNTTYLATVPCDVPNFPLDWVARVTHAMRADDAELGWVSTLEAGTLQPHPVFCVAARNLSARLALALNQGVRKVELWFDSCQAVRVTFEDATAFANANTEGELRKLESAGR